MSTVEQNPKHQIDALLRAGVAPDGVHVDHASGAKASRPQLDLVLQLLRVGDTLVITRLDRLGRSVLHLVTLGAQLRERGIGLRVVEQGIDTSTVEGRAMFGMLSVLAELQRELIQHPRRPGRRPRPGPQRRTAPEADLRAGRARAAALRRPPAHRRADRRAARGAAHHGLRAPRPGRVATGGPAGGVRIGWPSCPRPTPTTLRAALLDHHARGLPVHTLFAHPAGGLLLAQRMANLIARAAALADVHRPLAALRAGRSNSGPVAPFAAVLVASGAVRIDGAGPPPRLRPHLPPRTLPYVGRRARAY